MRINEPTSAELLTLAEAVRPYLSEKRYRHTLMVEKEAAYIASYVLPEREGSLRAAALLHDVAKEIPCEKQLNYIIDFDIIKRDPKTLPEAILHALAAPAVIKEAFPDYADEDILSATRYHTTGREEMTLFEAIIFLADYTEETRKYESCRRCREYLHAGLAASENREAAIEVFTSAVAMSLEDTLSHIKSKNRQLDPDTERAALYLMRGGQLRR